MKPIIYVLFLFFSFSAFAQYPFEKYPAIKYIKVPFKILYFQKDSSRTAVARYGNYLFQVREKKERQDQNYSCTLFIYLKENQILTTKIDPNIFWADNSFPLKIADINGDGLVDFKITFPNAEGSGLAGSRIWRVYLFNKGRNKFDKISLGDFYSEEKDEYDFNGDGNYEIIGQHYVSYKWHAYWAFNVYNYRKGTLVNVSNGYHYPIMVNAFQKKESYQITNKIPRKKMKSFSLIHPEFYGRDY